MNVIQDISLGEEGGVKGGGGHGCFVRNPGEGAAKGLIILPAADAAGGIADRLWHNGCGKADGADNSGGG